MDIANCKKCGRLFNYIGGDKVCPECRKELEEKFQQVKVYLGENRNSTIEDVSRDNDVSVQQVRQWIKEERITFAENSSVGIECERCGKMIPTGRYCEKCKNKLHEILGSALNGGTMREEADENKEVRMRFLK